MIALLRIKRALKVLKLPHFVSWLQHEDIVDAFLETGAELNELQFHFYDQERLNLFLTHYWSLAQHLPRHPLSTVTNLHLSTYDVDAPLSDNPTTFLNIFPDLNKLDCVLFIFDEVTGIAEFVELIIAFLQKYHSTAGNLKLLHLEAGCEDCQDEVIAEQVHGRIICHFHFREEQDKKWLTFQKANAVFELELSVVDHDSDDYDYYSQTRSCFCNDEKLQCFVLLEPTVPRNDISLV